MSYPVLAPVSEGYPKVQGRLLTCYSPVRRSSTPKGLSARLACVKHAASVRPEPGSNSPTKTCGKNVPATNQICCQRNPSLIAPEEANQARVKLIGTGFTSTLLSSQRTTAHRYRIPVQGPALGATAQTYPVGFALARSEILPAPPKCFPHDARPPLSGAS